MMMTRSSRAAADIGMSGRFPKFVIRRSSRFARNSESEGPSYDSRTAFSLEVPGANLPRMLQELQLGGTRPASVMRCASRAMTVRRSVLSIRGQRAISGSVRPQPKQRLVLGSMMQTAMHGVSSLIREY
jgi:hypothetical protein